MTKDYKPQGRISYDDLLRDHTRLSEYRKYAEAKIESLERKLMGLTGKPEPVMVCLDAVDGKPRS
jgi:hypothetical protein